jgi:hypothetical protein
MLEKLLLNISILLVLLEKMEPPSRYDVFESVNILLFIVTYARFKNNKLLNIFLVKLKEHSFNWI